MFFLMVSGERILKKME
uniref:Uncharacterized protein n=1 Tax=Arundo donax TaxID=35708 RepID=A0A0A9C8L3_ARUDO